MGIVLVRNSYQSCGTEIKNSQKAKAYRRKLRNPVQHAGLTSEKEMEIFMYWVIES